MGRFKSSSKPGPDSETLACSDEYPPFDSLIERNPSKKRREVYARYKPLSGLVHIPIPGTLHWAVEVISAAELAKEGFVGGVEPTSGLSVKNIISRWMKQLNLGGMDYLL